MHSTTQERSTVETKRIPGVRTTTSMDDDGDEIRLRGKFYSIANPHAKQNRNPLLLLSILNNSFDKCMNVIQLRMKKYTFLRFVLLLYET